MEAFKFKNINFESLGQAVSKYSNSLANKTTSMANEMNIDQQLELNRLKYEKLVADRQKELTKNLSVITASETKRGIVSGGAFAEEIAKEYERADLYAEQEMLATERNLLFAKEIEKAVAKNNEMNSLISIGNSVVGGFSEAFLPYKGGK